MSRKVRTANSSTVGNDHEHETGRTSQLILQDRFLNADQPDLTALVQGASEDHQQFLISAKQALAHAISCGRKLRAMREFVGHRVWEKTFHEVLAEPLGISLRSAQRYMAIAKDFQSFLVNQEPAEGPASGERTLFDASLVESFRSIRSRSQNEHKPDPNDWLTPPSVLGAARQYLGEIECEPCASASNPDHAGNAPCRYTVDQNGLAPGSGWSGKAWIAPGHHGDLSHWVAKAFSELESESIDEALLFLPSNVTEFSPRLLSLPFAQLRHKTPVLKPTAKGLKPGVLNVSMVVFLLSRSPQLLRFADAFRDIAVVFQPVQVPSSDRTLPGAKSRAERSSPVPEESTDTQS